MPTVFRTALLIALLLPLSGVRAHDGRGFIAGDTAVVAVRHGDLKIAIGERYSASFIKGRFGPFDVSFSNECEIECFVVSDGPATLEIFGDEDIGKVTGFTVWGEGSRDTLGNAVGMPLRDALKSDRAVCEYTEGLMCDSLIPGVRYFVDGDASCEWSVMWDKVEAGDLVDVPSCARLGGIHVWSEPRMKRPTSGGARPASQP